MYDVDPQLPVLRLGSVQSDKPVEAVEPRSTAEILALAERQMEEAIKRWSSAYMDWTRERKQSQPIASAPRSVGDSMMRYR